MKLSPYVLTESGRLVDESRAPVKEFFDGAWRKARSPLFGEDVLNGRTLSPEEVDELIKSGKFN